MPQAILIVRKQTIVKYLRQNLLSILFFGYFFFAVVLRSYTNVNITMPCPIKYVTGKECLGCGLTQATCHIFQFQIKNAWEANPLVFVALPLLSFLLLRHFYRFVKEEIKLHNMHGNH